MLTEVLRAGREVRERAALHRLWVAWFEECPAGGAPCEHCDEQAELHGGADYHRSMVEWYEGLMA